MSVNGFDSFAAGMVCVHWTDLAPSRATHRTAHSHHKHNRKCMYYTRTLWLGCKP